MEQPSMTLPAPFAWVEISGRGYSIGKYPLTNAQYALFIEAGGYDQRQWWTDAGWDAKLNGLALDYMKGEGVPTEHPWTEPRFWRDRAFNGAEQPVVGVSWYEATAYCRWLSAATGDSISLPTEAHWQYAAQGDDGRLYPWSNTWDCARCNNSVKPCQSDRTTPVRQYEGVGDSPFGVVDMAGNVWEWCLTDFSDASNDLDENRPRVIRGGAWFYFTRADCRNNFRYGDVPFSGYNFRGFRIAKSA